VCEEGRNIGLGVTFLTQRSARMNKSVSELADVMLAFRTIGPNSLAAIMDWLGEHVEKRGPRSRRKVRELNIGQALVVSPGLAPLEKVVQIRERETFDSSATPKPGQRAKRVTAPRRSRTSRSTRAKMAATIEKAKADDPKALRSSGCRRSG
jgi:DNA helicase HerA-like ATPase